MPSGGRRLPPWTSPRGAAEVATRWSPCTPAGALVFGSHVTPPMSAGCCSYRVTPPASGGPIVTPLLSGGGCSRPPRAPPALDSPYVRAKQAQLIEKDPNKAVPLFWAAINSGERTESALKDMATVLKQANRAEEAIEAIRTFRDRCPNEAQDSLDNILIDLYKKCGRTKEQIEMLTVKLRMVDEDLASGRWKTKLSKSHGRVVYLSLRDEKARLLGNLAWAYMQSENFEEAEMLYRQALAIEADYNKECNLAICLIKIGKGFTGGARKTWADMVEEDEQQLGDGKNTTAQGDSRKHASEQRGRTPPSSSQESSSLKTPVAGVRLQSSSAGSWRRNDSRISTHESVNRKSVRTAPAWKHQKVPDNSNRVCQRLNTVHLSEKAQGTEKTPWRSSAAQRSLFHSHVPSGDSGNSQGASHSEATSGWPKNAASIRPWRPQNRLRVFRDITDEMNQNVTT